MFLSDEREKYILHSKLKLYHKKVGKAIQCVNEALSKSKKPALSFSGGKDSIVLLDISIKAGFSGEIVFFKYGIVSDVETPKENIEILTYYAESHGLKYHVLDCLGEVDCWEKCGRFILYPETETEKKIFNETNYDYVKQSKKFETEHNIDLNIIGMRKDESTTRKIMLSKKGAIYQTKSRSSVTCCPLLNFSNFDIWAYIFSNNLKYLSIYDYPYIDRCINRNEITMLYNDAIIENGMMWHYKKMYPDFFEWLESRYGNIGM